MLRKMISPVVCTDKLQFDSARFIFLLQLSGGEGGNTFRRCTK